MARRTILTEIADGTKFKIREEGLVWTLYIKEKGKPRFERIQSASDLKFLKQVMYNQPEFKKLKKVI